MLDSNAVETIAVGTISNCVVLSPCLDEHINKRDKEPSVDGFVNLYKPGGKIKENFYGRVAVQVKGTQKKISSNNNIVKFAVDISDLDFYQKEGGVIFFYVWISLDGKQRRIFHNELLPVKIYKILSEVDRQSGKSLKFKELTDEVSVERLFFAFYDEKKKQKDNLVDLPQLPSIDSLQEQNVLSSLTFSVLNVEGYRNRVQAILNNDVYMYANIKGSPFPVPLGMIDDSQGLTFVRDVHKRISAGDVVYEKSKVIESHSEIVINVENWFTVTYTKIPSKLGNRIDIKFTPRKTLRERVKDIEFLLSFVDTGGFYLGDFFCDFKATESSIRWGRFSANFYREELVLMKRTLLLFGTLYINDNIDMTALCEDDIRELKTLVLAFVDRKPIKNLKDDLPFNYYIKIDRIVLALYHYEKGGKKYIGDVLNSELSAGFDTDGETHFVPIYAMLDVDGWSRISNIDFCAVLQSFINFYEKHGDSMLFSVANNTLLSILLAYDNTKKPQLLDLAFDLSEWLLNDSSPEGVGNEISLINHFQVIARKQGLTHNNTKELFRIAESNEVETRIRVGAYLLLGNYTAAEMHYQNLDEETQLAFKSWPIYHFWKGD